MTVLLFQPAGASAPVVGAVRSMLTAALSAVVLLPALSVTVAVSLRPLPSPVIVLLAGAEATPERSSAAVQSIVTSPLYQPLPFAAAVGLPRQGGRGLVDVDAADRGAGRVAGRVDRGALERLVGALTEGLVGGDAVDAGQGVLAVEVRR